MSLSVILARRYMPCLDGIRRVVRHISALARSPYDNTKLVYISESRDVFANLALEHWMYRHFDFSKQHILLLWRNSPCIVFGRDQNPWLDCDIPAVSKENLLVIRRNSDGYVVYHDEGKLNLSFFTPKERYDPKHNLDVIKVVLSDLWDLRSEIKYDDIIIEGDHRILFNLFRESYLHLQNII